jgi:RimJ/RimL family protein N-acetyltransferase
MKLPYLGIHNPILSHLTDRFSGKGNGRHTTAPSSQPAITTSRFHFSKAVPKSLKGDQWQLQKLQQTNAALTYEAYLNHPAALLQQSQDRFLPQPYTWQDHTKQIATYEQEHQTHSGFSYTVLNKAGTKCLGMVQVMPLRPFLYYNNAPAHLIIRANHNAAMITYWLAPCPTESNFPCQFIQALQRWFDRTWEFDDYYFRINPSDTHCLTTVADSGLEAHFSLKVPPVNYTFYGH